MIFYTFLIFYYMTLKMISNSKVKDVIDDIKITKKYFLTIDIDHFCILIFLNFNEILFRRYRSKTFH